MGRTAKGGAHPVLTLDGKTAAEADYPATAGESRLNQTIGVDVPAGAHTVSVFNTGPDWYMARSITVTGYAPAVGALARGDAHAAVFWAYARDRSASAPLNAQVTLPGLMRRGATPCACGRLRAEPRSPRCPFLPCRRRRHDPADRTPGRCRRRRHGNALRHGGGHPVG